MLSTLGELLFTVAIGYMGAIEFLFVLKHLYHWSFQHHQRLRTLHEQGDEEGLKQLQEHIRKSIAEATKKEVPGYQQMKDGVLYKDGFRVDRNSVVSPEMDEKNQSIKREVIGSSGNSFDKTKNELTLEECATETENSEQTAVQEEVNKKQISDTEESQSKIDEQIEVQEELIVKEQVPLIMSSNDTSEQTRHSQEPEKDYSQIDLEDPEDSNERINLTQTVKTQYGQTKNEHYSLRSPPLTQLVTSKSDDSSSNEPWSSQKSSSLSTQQSSSIDTPKPAPEIHFDEYERQAPDGEDVSADGEQIYTDEYLRSLDGIKNRPLIRDDGSGRRRAFKKRRSSGDSTSSSRDSRHSREEELKMFTSLEEEEFATMKKGIGCSVDDISGEITPSRYSSDPNLKVNKHHRRHKRSPAKETKSLENMPGGKTSLEMLGEEDTNPWGEIKPEHYKDSEFWKREKTNSIEEELEDPSLIWRDQDADVYNKEDNSDIVAGDTLASPTAKNIPKLSSFEEASHSQHEEAISVINRQGSKDAEPKTDEGKTNDNDKSEETKNVSNDDTSANTLAENIAFASAYDQQTPHETEEIACYQSDDHSESHSTGGLRRSPRMDEIDHYEERWEQEERRKSNSPLEHQTEESAASIHPSLEIKSRSIERSITPEKIEIKITYEPLIEHKDTIVLNKPSTPTIEVEYASDDESEIKKVTLAIEEDDDDYYDEGLDTEEPINIMAGLSDFYDFNASINPLPQRSRSTSMRRSRSAEPLSSASSIGTPDAPDNDEKPYEFIKRSSTPTKTEPKIQNIEFLSDFYDFNVHLNQKAYNLSFTKRDPDAHRDSIDLIVTDLKYIQPHCDTHLHLFETKNDLTEIQDDPKTPQNLNNFSPTTPDYQRSLSAEWNHVERLKKEMIEGGFKRSTYVGESADFSDDFEELREQTRHFRRSQSKSRSPALNKEQISKKELQERILDEITKTTINFQDFSRDLTQEFLENERRGSDSALIQKPEILIQFQDDSTDYLEADEYHHFRRFSIQQEYQVEEYPPDEIVYVDQIEVVTADGTSETWQRNDTYTSEDKGAFSQVLSNSQYEMPYTSTETMPEVQSDTSEICQSDHTYTSEDEGVISQVMSDIQDEVSNVSVEALEKDHNSVPQIWQSDETFNSENKTTFTQVVNNTQDEMPKISTDTLKEDYNHDNDADEHEELDSNSDDDRQTIVEVDDGIDEDIWDYNERTEESYNEQSECEEADRAVDLYANSNVNDWKEEGAVGGILDEEIDQMYDEAIKNRKESGIIRDYEGIIEKMDDDRTECDDSVSIRTDELLDEILKEDEEKYGWSPRRSRASSRESNRSLIENERRYLGDAVSQSISSTRLRSRYGLAPATGSYANFENNDDIDINYKPKKEYNWRKNFKLDEDEDSDKAANSSIKFRQSLKNEIDAYDDTDFDTRKYSLGGESITLFSRSRESSELGDYFENLAEANLNEDEKYNDGSSIYQELPQKYLQEFKEEIIENTVDGQNTEQFIEYQLEDADKEPKKKKSKKKVRKGSKGSIGKSDVDGIASRRESLIEFEIPENIDEAPKQKKKKKKVKEIVISEQPIKKVTEYDQLDNNEQNQEIGILSSITDDSSLSIPSNSKDFMKSKSPEITSPPILTSVVKPKKESSKTRSSDPEIPKSTESISSTNHSVSTSPDSYKRSEKLDRIDSSDIIELIRDSSILGSSF